MVQQVWKDFGRGCFLEFCCWEKTRNLTCQMAKVKPRWKVCLWTRIEECGGIEAEQQLECLIESQLPFSGTRRWLSPLLQRSSREQTWRKAKWVPFFVPWVLITIQQASIMWQVLGSIEQTVFFKDLALGKTDYTINYNLGHNLLRQQMASTVKCLRVMSSGPWKIKRILPYREKVGQYSRQKYGILKGQFPTQAKWVGKPFRRKNTHLTT